MIIPPNQSGRGPRSKLKDALSVLMTLIIVAMLFTFMQHRLRSSAKPIVNLDKAMSTYEQAADWYSEHDGSFSGFAHPNVRIADAGQSIEVRYQSKDGTRCLTRNDAGFQVDQPCRLFQAPGARPATR